MKMGELTENSPFKAYYRFAVREGKLDIYLAQLRAISNLSCLLKTRDKEAFLT